MSLHAHPDLPQIILALRPLARGTRGHDRGKQQRQQPADYRNHDEQLDDRESAGDCPLLRCPVSIRGLSPSPRTPAKVGGRRSVVRAGQSHLIIIAGKAGKNLCQEVVIPAGLESFAPEAAFEGSVLFEN